MGRSSFHTHLAPHPSPRVSRSRAAARGWCLFGGTDVPSVHSSGSCPGALTLISFALQVQDQQVGLLVCPEPRLTPADPAFGRPQLPAAPTLEPAALWALGCWAGEEGRQRQLSGQAEGLPSFTCSRPAEGRRPPGRPGPGVSVPGLQAPEVSRLLSQQGVSGSSFHGASTQQAFQQGLCSDR
uniref:Uncharacterized protein n=1 Tax=Myotis myotis TaxID=51298 RepID=A0A7J7R3P0_MYOMY|nr:hypothetical protein mMyoMyo1_010909 [Myotis myotis]